MERENPSARPSGTGVPQGRASVAEHASTEHGCSFPVLFAAFQTENRANGGIESLTQIIERLQQVQPIIVTQAKTPVNERWRRAGAEVQVWPFARRSGGPTDESSLRQKGRLARAMARANAAIYRLVRERACRVVHCNDIRMLWHAGWGARLAGAQVVFNVRDTFSPERSYDWKWKGARLLSRRVLVLSAEMRASLAWRLRGPFQGADRAAAQTDFIHSIVDPEQMHPVDEEERRRLRERLGMAEEELALSYVATVNDKKNQLCFIEEAGPLLRERLPAATVYFVGDFEPERDAYARRCRKAMNRLGLNDVFEFVGYSDEVGDWYRAADVGLIASRREGMARCMIEALACGTPVVSFDVCSAREILEEHDCGRVAPQGDYRQLVHHIEELAASTQERQRLGKNGENTARQLFDPASIVEQYEQLYRELDEQVLT